MSLAHVFGASNTPLHPTRDMHARIQTHFIRAIDVYMQSPLGAGQWAGPPRFFVHFSLDPLALVYRMSLNYWQVVWSIRKF